MKKSTRRRQGSYREVMVEKSLILGKPKGKIMNLRTETGYKALLVKLHFFYDRFFIETTNDK